MKPRFPSADEYAAQQARHPALTVFDIRADQMAIRESYRNEVLSNVNDGCARLSVLQDEYPWHLHADSDELFLVVAGKLQIDVDGHGTVELAEWQCMVVPAGTVHRTRAVGRTVTVTFEKQGAETRFVEKADDGAAARRVP